MEIRFAQPGDIPEMIRLLQQVGQVHHVGRPDLFRAGAQKYDENALLELLQDPSRPIFIAAASGKVLGYAFCICKEVKDNPVLADQRELYIDDLCVDEACRGQAIGTKLYRAVQDYARQEQFDRITLNVWAFNESALRFYEKLGLKPQKIGMEAPVEEETC